jgi:hypothetical protein
VAVSAALAYLIRQTRPILSGVAVFREQRIDDTTAITPIADALIILRTRLRPATASVLLWSDRPRATDEQFRIVSVEVDRGTEDLGVIAEKARRYRRLPSDPSFQERYRGLCPEVLWVALTERRMRSIDQIWRAVWPEGTWLLAHAQALSRDQFWTSEPGGLRPRGWLDWIGLATSGQTIPPEARREVLSLLGENLAPGVLSALQCLADQLLRGDAGPAVVPPSTPAAAPPAAPVPHTPEHTVEALPAGRAAPVDDPYGDIGVEYDG